MGWKKKSAIPQIRAALRSEVMETVEFTSIQVLTEAKRLVPQPGKSRGYATGALKAAGYIAEQEVTGAAHAGSYDYESAITDAQSAPDTDILKRDQILPELFVPAQPKNHFLNFVDFPLSYAHLIHNGFFHILADRHIIGTMFLESAVNAGEPEFVRALKNAMQALENMGIPTEREQAVLATERYENRVLARAGAQARRENAIMWQQFRASVYPEELRIQKGSVVRGVTRTGKAIYGRETRGERDFRVGELFEAWKNSIADNPNW